MFSKPLIGFFVDRWGCVPSLLFDLRPNYGGDNEKVPCMHTLLHSVPRTLQQATVTHSSAGNSLTFMGKSGSVSCGITAPFSWVLVCTRFCLCPPRVCFPVLCRFWWLDGGVNGDLLQEGLCHTQVCRTQSPCPCSSPLLTRTSSGGSHSPGSVSVGSLGPGAHKFCDSPPSVSGGYGV